MKALPVPMVNSLEYAILNFSTFQRRKEGFILEHQPLRPVALRRWVREMRRRCGLETITPFTMS